MPITLLLLLIPVLTLFTAVLIRRHQPQQARPTPVYRLHPGVAHKAEWMAAPEVIQQVVHDYRASLTWATEALADGYPRYLRELSHYFVGEGFNLQRQIVLTHVRRSGTRLIGLLEAQHTIEVRRFSSDGLTCDLFDLQTHQRMITFDLWSKRRINEQALGAALYVYRMQYDAATNRWKIAQRAQQLPIGCSLTHAPTASVQLTDRMPVAAGHDW